MYDRVFISYAREDFKQAEEIYNFLIQKGLKPWMDKKNLLAGQDWDFHIQTELRRAEYVIVIFSENSVSKRGYVQKEFKTVLRYLEEKLDTDIYIIPLRLDGCTIPPLFSKLQYLQYDSSEIALEAIVTSINLQRDKLVSEDQKKKNNLLGLGVKEQRVEGIYGSKNPKQFYEIDYFLFTDSTNESLNELNTVIHSEVLKYLFHARSNFFSYLDSFPWKKDEEYDGLFYEDSTLYGSFHLSNATKQAVSFTNFWSVYDSGAAHGQYWTSGHNYFLHPLRSITIPELFESENIFQILSEIVHVKLMAHAKKDLEIDNPENFYLLGDKLEPEFANFENFCFSEIGIIFFYNPYHITAWPLGDHQAEITFEELQQAFPSDQKLIKFIANWRS